MLLLLTTSYSSINHIVPLLEMRRIEYFRMDMDCYWKYRFRLADNEFEISSPDGRSISSRSVSMVALFKAQMFIEDPFPEGKGIDSPRWVHSSLNSVLLCLVRWAIDRRMLKLWTPYELLYPKTLQMHRARKYFRVPSYCISWGYEMDSCIRIMKPINGRPMDNGAYIYARLMDVHDLSPEYPWFTQEPAKGNRDATVLFINGKVHCFQFATERGDLTDWRVTQGTDANKWEPWNAGEEFEGRIRAYMHDMGLKFGRLDFIIGGEEPEFLEVNPCGQFGWLDDDSLALHNEILDAILDPSSVIIL